jgi:PAS domain S-box-containing protein
MHLPSDSAPRAQEAAYLLAAIVDSSMDAIISQDLSGTVTTWNTAAHRMFGYSAEEIVGRSILAIIPMELHQQQAEVIDRVKGGERIDQYETTRLRRDGSMVEVSLTISPVRSADGSVIGISKIARDITRERRADQATRLLAAIVDSSDDAIVSKNLNGVVTSWNKGAERVFGYTADEMIGQPISKLFPPDRLEEEPMILERLKRGERVDHYQTVRVRKGGEKLHVSLTISPIKDSFGRIVGASKIARDITREMAAVEQLARANEELKRADRMKTEFLAVMSHELRTPLNSIIGFAGVLKQGRQGPLADEQRKQLNLIQSSGKHLLNLVNDLLDVSRIEAGRLEIEPEELTIAEVVEEAVRTTELQAASKHLEVRTEITVQRPIYSDRKRLFQVVLNLLNNAIKFTPAGHVLIRAAEDGEWLVVTVKDTGIGIPRDKQSSLFQAFSQVEGSSRRRFEGTGLGLYLSRKLVHLLGGEITLESEINRGSVFTVRVPLHFNEGHAPGATGS